VVADDGKVYDSDRVMFLRACLGQLQRATADGVPVDGYFHWSAQDNFEWMDGFGNASAWSMSTSTPSSGSPSSARSGSGRQHCRTP
jgi:Glycosyl hydrolase family 1